jgi:hypothetical protein
VQMCNESFEIAIIVDDISGAADQDHKPDDADYSYEGPEKG